MGADRYRFEQPSQSPWNIPNVEEDTIFRSEYGAIYCQYGVGDEQGEVTSSLRRLSQQILRAFPFTYLIP
jgi:hypothetical protein